jgi:hypothetical protein
MNAYKCLRMPISNQDLLIEVSNWLQMAIHMGYPGAYTQNLEGYI